MPRTAVAFRLSDEANEKIEEIAKSRGVSKTAAVELAVREAAVRPDLNALIVYEGTGEATLAGNRSVPARFRIVQDASGDLEGHCVLENGRRARGGIASVSGLTADGWEIRVDCHPAGTSFLEFPWDETYFSPRIVIAHNAAHEQVEAATLSAALTNFEFPDHYPQRALPIDWQGQTALIVPIADYRQRIEILERQSGVRQTATCAMDVHAPTSILEFRDSLTEILTPLSLATGRIVSIPLIEMRDAEERAIARWHGDVVVHPYKSQARALGLSSNPVKLVSAWGQLDSADARASLRRRVHHFLDCLTPAIFLESRALLAVSLLEALTIDFEGRPAQPSRSPPLAKRLTSMAKELHIDLTATPDICPAVAATRNSLIHHGTFASSAGDASSSNRDRLAETIQAQWLAFAFLTHLIDPTIGIRPMFDVHDEDPGFNPIQDLDL